MPDITLCRGGTCPLRKKCHRHLAKPYRIGQSYFVEVPNKGGKCDYYWPEKREDK